MLFLLLVSILLSIPAVQTKIGSYVTNKINEDFGTNLNIEKVDLSFLGNVQLKGVEIRDHHKDTLIFVQKLSTSLLNAKKIIDNEVNLNSVSLDGAYYYMKTYKGEDDDNMSIFIDSFGEGSPKDSLSKPFTLNATNVYVNNLNFHVINANKKDSINYAVRKAGGNFQNLAIVGGNVSSNVRGMYFTELFGLKVTNLTTDFSLTKTAMLFKKTRLQTKNTDIKGDIDFTYKEGDLKHFIDKVNFKIRLDDSKVAVQDVKNYYKELSGNHILYFTGNMNGPLIILMSVN